MTQPALHVVTEVDNEALGSAVDAIQGKPHPAQEDLHYLGQRRKDLWKRISEARGDIKAQRQQSRASRAEYSQRRAELVAAHQNAMASLEQSRLAEQAHFEEALEDATAELDELLDTYRMLGRASVEAGTLSKAPARRRK